MHRQSPNFPFMILTQLEALTSNAQRPDARNIQARPPVNQQRQRPSPGTVLRLCSTTPPPLHPGLNLTSLTKYSPKSPPLPLHMAQSETFQILTGRVGTTLDYSLTDTIWTPADPTPQDPSVATTLLLARSRLHRRRCPPRLGTSKQPARGNGPCLLYQSPALCKRRA